MSTVHRDENQVRQAVSAPSQIERENIFDQLRKEGIYEHNKKLLEGGNKTLIHRERSNKRENDDAVYCTSCLGFYSRSYFSIHRKKCASDSAVTSAEPVRSEFLSNKIEISREFETTILSKFNRNEIGDMCRNEEMIVTFGAMQFEKIRGRADKKVELKRSVMADMRRMVHLYIIFKNKCVARNVHCASPSDMLQRKNMSLLKEAIETYTDGGKGQLKSGLRNALYYLIVNFAMIHKTTCLVQERPEDHKKIEEFIEVFKLYQHAWFGTARYNLTKNRQLILRRPQELPSEEDVTTVKKYSLEKMNELLSDEFLIWTETEYVQLRDLVVCRLILFNARRVGEPSRLTLSEWEDAENGVWLDPQRRGNYDEEDAAFFQDLKITFQGGKGNKLVSVFFPS